MFYNQNTSNSFYKSDPWNLSHFIVKLIEELRILLLKLKLGLPLKSKSPNSLSEKLGIFILGMFMQTTANHLRGLHMCLLNDDSAEKNGKGIKSPYCTSIKSLHNLGNYVWIYAH